MSDTRQMLVFGGPMVLLLVMLAVQASFYYARRRRGRQRNAELAAAIGTISGVCYRVTASGVTPLVADERAPPDTGDFTAMLASLSAETRQEISQLLDALVATGKGFSRRVANAAGSVMLALTGHRLISDGRVPLHLVWVADVTEQEASARESRRIDQECERLKAVFDALPVPAWYREIDGGRTIGNKAFVGIEELGPAADELSRQIRRSGTGAQAEIACGVESAVRQFLLTEMPIEGGTSVGLAIDHTEIKRLEREFERLSRAHQQVLESFRAAVAIWGPDGKLLFANAAFVRLWAVDPQMLAGSPPLTEVLDALRERRLMPEYLDFRKFKLEMMELFTTLKEPREELMHLPDERTLRLGIARHPFGGLTFTYEDVTDRLALERSFNTLNEVQRETLDNLFEGIAVFGSDGRLKLYNPTFATLWRLDAELLTNRPHIAALAETIRSSFSESNWREVRAIVVERVTSPEPFTGRIERTDGSVLQVNAVPLPDGNMLFTYLDITDTMRLQDALVEKDQALETANRLKSEFIANVSYELRTPLNAIIGFSEILANQYFGPLNERQIGYTQAVLESGQRLLMLISDILDLAAIEAGQIELEPEAVDVHLLLAGILAQIRDRAAELDLTIDFECETDIGIVVADRRRLRQVLANLVTNAIKFTPPGGTVTLAAERRDGEIGLVVSDTGAGIDPSQLTRVFETFERAHSTRSVGAGLGLPLAKSFIELHGGRVEIKSAPGRGTRVVCWLPSGVRHLNGAAEPTAAASRIAPRRLDLPSPERPGPERPAGETPLLH